MSEEVAEVFLGERKGESRTGLEVGDEGKEILILRGGGEGGRGGGRCIDEDGDAFDFGVLETNAATAILEANVKQVAVQESPTKWGAIFGEEVTGTIAAIPITRVGTRIGIDDPVSEEAEEVGFKKHTVGLQRRSLAVARRRWIGGEGEDFGWGRSFLQRGAGKVAIGQGYCGGGEEECRENWQVGSHVCLASRQRGRCQGGRIETRRRKIELFSAMADRSIDLISSLSTPPPLT